MKKFLVVLMALLFATGAFAQDAEKKAAEFKYSIFGNAFGVMGQQDDYAEDYSHIRVRPKFAAVNGDVQAVVQFEIDQRFGYTEKNISDDAADPEWVKDDNGAAAGTDNKVVEVKHAFIAVNNAVVQGFSVLGGLNAAFYPLVVDNDFAMAQFGYDFGMGKVTFTNIKLVEGSDVDNTAADVESEDDINAYMLDVNVKVGEIAIKPAVTMIKADEFTTNDYADYAEANLTNIAINVDGSMGAINFGLTAAYLMGDINADIEAKGYAVDAEVGFKVNEMITVGVFGTYTSGDDDAADDEVCSYTYVMNETLGAPAGRLYLLQDGTHLSGAKAPYDVNSNELGIMAFGLMADVKPADKVALAFQYGYVATAEETAAGDSFIGHEIDIYAAYEVAAATNLFVEIGYIVAGDDMNLGQYATAENAFQVAYGISTKI